MSNGLAHTRISSAIDPGFVEIGRACIHTYVLAQLLCRLLYTFGAALFSRQRNFFLYYCDMCLRFRGCPVVLDTELSVSAWYQKKDSTCAAAREAYSVSAAACSIEGWCAVCGITFKIKSK